MESVEDPSQEKFAFLVPLRCAHGAHRLRSLLRNIIASQRHIICRKATTSFAAQQNKRTGCRTAHLSFYGSKIYPNGTQKYPVGPKKNYFLTAASLFLNLSRRPPASTNFCLPV